MSRSFLGTTRQRKWKVRPNTIPSSRWLSFQWMTSVHPPSLSLTLLLMAALRSGLGGEGGDEWAIKGMTGPIKWQVVVVVLCRDHPSCWIPNWTGILIGHKLVLSIFIFSCRCARPPFPLRSFFRCSPSNHVSIEWHGNFLLSTSDFIWHESPARICPSISVYSLTEVEESSSSSSRWWWSGWKWWCPIRVLRMWAMGDDDDDSRESRIYLNGLRFLATTTASVEC